MPELPDTTALLRQAITTLAEPARNELTWDVQIQLASALALVAIGINLQRTADALELLESRS
jgi:hypothetical protein